MSENENISQSNNEDNSKNPIYFEENNINKFEEEHKTPEISINLDNVSNNKISVENKNDKKNNIDETPPYMVETKVYTKILEEMPQIQIIFITNICGGADLNCKLDLKILAMNALNSKYTFNFEYNPKKNNFVKMKLKTPKSYAQFYSSGKMICTGVKSEKLLQKAIIKYNKIIKSCGFSTKLKMEKIVINNITATWDIKFKIQLTNLYSYLANLQENGVKVHYDSENFPALIYYKLVDNSNMRILIYASGKIVITGAKKKENICNILNDIYPELLKFTISN